MIYFWIALMVALIIIEIITPQLVTIWFALGALGAIISSLLEVPVWAQFLVFLIISGISLLSTRPLIKKLALKNAPQPTNADRVIGAHAIVTEEINNTFGKGLVTVKGAVWTARSDNDSVIPKDTQVIIKKIDGVKLIVGVIENV